MKLILASCAVLLLSLSVSANTDDSSATFLQVTIEQMTQAYIKGAAQDAAFQKMDQLAGQYLEKSVADSKGLVSAPVGKVLLAYSFMQNVKGYHEAQSETQRYQAFSHGAADALTFYLPPAGAIAQLIVLAQDLGAAFIMKKYQLKSAQLISEIERLRQVNSDLQKKERDALNAAYVLKLGYFTATQVLVEASSKEIKERCSRGKNTNGREYPLQHCLVLNQKQLTLYKLYRGHFANFHQFIRTYKIGDTAEEQKLLGLLEQINKGMEQAEQTVSQLQRDLLTQSWKEIRTKISASRLTRKCESFILALLTKRSLIRKSLFESSEDMKFIYEEDMIENKRELDSALEALCKDVKSQLDPELLNLVEGNTP